MAEIPHLARDFSNNLVTDWEEKQEIEHVFYAVSDWNEKQVRFWNFLGQG